MAMKTGTHDLSKSHGYRNDDNQLLSVSIADIPNAFQPIIYYILG